MNEKLNSWYLQCVLCSILVLSFAHDRVLSLNETVRAGFNETMNEDEEEETQEDLNLPPDPEILRNLNANSGSKKFRIRKGFLGSFQTFSMMALIKIKGGGTCSGSILDAWTILTAAHCLCPGQYEVEEIYFATLDSRYPHEKALPGKVVIQPSYLFCKGFTKNMPKKPPSPFDIGIIKTKTKIPLRKELPAISKIRLTRYGPAKVAYRKAFYVVGYGLDSADLTYYDELKSGVSKVTNCPMEDALCLADMANTQFPEPGDSGGPVMYLAGKTFYQVGLVSGPQDDVLIVADVCRNIDFIISQLGNPTETKKKKKKFTCDN